MKSAALGCGVVLAALLVMIGLWWLLAAFVFSTGDDGPTGQHATTSTPWSTT